MKISDRDKKDWFLLRFGNPVTTYESTLKSGWKSITLKGDTLIGLDIRSMYFYETRGGAIGFRPENGVIVIYTKGSIFDYKVINHSVKVIVGYYNSDNDLIKSERVRFRVWKEKGTFAHCIKREVNDRINNFLSAQSGNYIRIVAERYHSSEFDIKVPCIFNTEEQ